MFEPPPIPPIMGSIREIMSRLATPTIPIPISHLVTLLFFCFLSLLAARACVGVNLLLLVVMSSSYCRMAPVSLLKASS